MVESQPSKLLVAGSIPVSRSIFSPICVASIGFAPIRACTLRNRERDVLSAPRS